MSRLSQLFWFLNEDKLPTIEEQKTIYTDIQITEELKALRRKWRQEHGTDNREI
jgi:hypothetical protein